MRVMARLVKSLGFDGSFCTLLGNESATMGGERGGKGRGDKWALRLRIESLRFCVFAILEVPRSSQRRTAFRL